MHKPQPMCTLIFKIVWGSTPGIEGHKRKKGHVALTGEKVAIPALLVQQFEKTNIQGVP